MAGRYHIKTATIARLSDDRMGHGWLTVTSIPRSKNICLSSGRNPTEWSFGAVGHTDQKRLFFKTRGIVYLSCLSYGSSTTVVVFARGGVAGGVVVVVVVVVVVIGR